MTTEEFKLFVLICLAMMILVTIYCWEMYHIEKKRIEWRNQLIYNTYLEIEKELEGDEND